MNLAELNTLLKATGYPVAYSHFNQTSVPSPPYIVYLVAFSPHFVADNRVYKKIDSVQIELYTMKKDLTAEKKLEDQLDQNEIPYLPSETFIESEGLFQKIYEVRMI